MYNIIITCEHASDFIPECFKERLKIPQNTEQHRFFDKNALIAARMLAELSCGELFVFNTSRLLIDANRSPASGNLFGRHSAHLPYDLKLKALTELYLPFRNNVLNSIRSNGISIHLSIHSFTDVYNGRARDFDIGILFDPSRKNEKSAAEKIKSALCEAGFKTVLNRPYKGTADGHTTALRTSFSADRYIGLELEFSDSLDNDRLKAAALIVSGQADILKNCKALKPLSI